MGKRYYWLKLDRRFFKRHDIRIVEAMPNGKDYILFYLKLLCESVSHDGELRFSEAIPYNEQMLAIVTETNVDVVKAALKTFSELNMIEILDDGTLYMTESQKMLGSEGESAGRMRAFRERKNVALLNEASHSDEKVTESKRKRIDIEKDTEKEQEGTLFAYANAETDSATREALLFWLNEMEISGSPLTDAEQKAIVEKLKHIPKNERESAIRRSGANHWRNVYPRKEDKKAGAEKAQRDKWNQPVTPDETDRIIRLTQQMEAGE